MRAPGFCAKEVATGADGSVWVLSCTSTGGGYTIHYYNRATDSFVQIDGGATQIDVMANGLPWVSNSNGNIYKRNPNNTWTMIDGCAKEVAVGRDNTLWVVGCN